MLKFHFKKLFSLFLIFLCLLNFNTKASASQYKFLKYHIDVKLNEDGRIDIIEEYQTKFDSPFKHGIYLNIPEKYDMLFDNKEHRYFFPITNIKLLSKHEYEVKSSFDGKTIIIGSPDYYANEFETYRIAYSINTTNLDLENKHDLLYLNLLGKKDTSIQEMSFRIESFKEFNAKEMKFYLNKVNLDLANIKALENNDLLKDLRIGSNTISASLINPIKADSNFTVFLDLNENYFNFSSFELNDTIPWIIIFVIINISFIVLHYLYGRNKKIIAPVTFELPKDLDPLKASYLNNFQIDIQASSAMIFLLAKDHYLKLEEVEKEIIITKLKDYDGDDAKLKRLMNALFRKKDSISLKDKSINLYKYHERCVSDTYMYFKGKRKLYHGSIYSYILPIISFAYLYFYLSKQFEINYKIKSFHQEEFLLLIFLIFIASLVQLIFSCFFASRIGLVRTKRFINVGFCIIGFLVHSFLFFISYLFSIKLIIPNVLMCFINCLNILIASYMGKYSDYAVEKMAYVEGFKKFIKDTQKDQIELLAKDHPNLFMDVLPYAYAFNLTNLWLEKFSVAMLASVGINAGSIYLSQRFYRNLAYSSRSSYVSSIPKASKGSGGFSGGSSGGGFSGGGFGGSSGGSW